MDFYFQRKYFSNLVERERCSLGLLFLVYSLLKQNAKPSFLCFEFVSISAKPSTKYSLLVGIKIHSNELLYPFPWVDKSEIVKNSWMYFKKISLTKQSIIFNQR